ncbi:uncharacterized protein J4E92_009076 [Alternaria infectoria]|uniref:uncharacterized protein n=1 Tax=Alternaria infectoria TaxID=45303 RepID=UPI00222062DD|nr:uncharacterized protein J4E92_009076 [Alternaria infectoria]KAI4916572.1 hypothetical protein J4E92_009076 [Alternaria infectoria]
MAPHLIGSLAREIPGADEVPTPQSKAKVKVPASSPPEHVSNTESIPVDEDSDVELSDDPAPYAGRELVNKELTPKETFAPHDTDPTKIEATFKVQMPDGKSWFIQKNIIPEKRESADRDLYEADDSIFFPDLESCKVPKKDKEKKSNPVVEWNKVSENRWERTFKGINEVFTPSIALRRFNARTRAYEHVHVNQSKLTNIDPNDKKWKDAYNKWIDQISRRSNAAYEKKKNRDHWTVPEICAMYTGINDFVHTKGFDAYDTITTVDLSKIVEAINKAGGKNRGLDALRGQITSAHATKNKTMAYLRENARDFRLLVEAGGVVGDEERYPKHMIPLSEFPVEKRANHRKGTGKPKVYKPKFRSVNTQTGDDKVVHEDYDSAVITSTARKISKKRKRDASASDSDEVEDQTELAAEESDEEEVEHGYGSDAGESSDEEVYTGDEPEYMEEAGDAGAPDDVKAEDQEVEDKEPQDVNAEVVKAADVEADALPPAKKPRVTDHAIELARQMLEDDSD